MSPFILFNCLSFGNYKVKASCYMTLMMKLFFHLDLCLSLLLKCLQVEYHWANYVISIVNRDFSFFMIVFKVIKSQHFSFPTSRVIFLVLWCACVHNLLSNLCLYLTMHRSKAAFLSNSHAIEHKGYYFSLIFLELCLHFCPSNFLVAIIQIYFHTSHLFFLE